MRRLSIVVEEAESKLPCYRLEDGAEPRSHWPRYSQPSLPILQSSKIDFNTETSGHSIIRPVTLYVR